jgi:hypothetical protein
MIFGTFTDNLTSHFGQIGKMGDAEVTASQWRLVEVGRVALLSSGPYSGKICAIVQIIDHKRVRFFDTSPTHGGFAGTRGSIIRS